MDAKTFDMTKFFNPESALDHAEKNTKSCTGFILDAQVRQAAETVSAAGFEFARAQVAAGRAFGDAMRKAFQI
jgi:uncharacterized protein (DUF1778 family)